MKLEVDASELKLFDERVEELLRLKHPYVVDPPLLETLLWDLRRQHFVVFFNRHFFKGDSKPHYYVGVRELRVPQAESVEKTSWLTRHFVAEYRLAKGYAQLVLDHFEMFLHKDFL